MELLLIIIVLSLLFDYINGFHDAANSIATIVSTKVLTPFQAVLWAAAFNFVAFFIAKYVIGGFGIANTVSKTVMEEYIYYMEFVYMVEGYSFFLFPYVDWWFCRCGYHGQWFRLYTVGYYIEDCGFYFSGSFDWYDSGIGIHDSRIARMPESASAYG